MILIISTNSEKLHEKEYVKPIEKILYENKIKFKTINYINLNSSHIKKSVKIIITGTSLKDNKFLNYINKFEFIKFYNRPILGICAGMQIISLIFNSKLKTKKEIGYYKETFIKPFLSLEGEHEVYHLHNNYTSLPKDFVSFTKSEIPQAIKHKSKNIYGVLFHPEVRNKALIKEFVNIPA